MSLAVNHPRDSSLGDDADNPDDSEQSYSIVPGFRYLARREFDTGRGERLFLTHCPICHKPLGTKPDTRHLESHNWADVEAMRERARLRSEGGGQATLPTSDPDAPW